MFRLIIFLSVFIMVVACQPVTDEPQTSSDMAHFKQLSTDNPSINQEPSNRAKELIQTNHAITHIYAVNSDKQMIVAFEIEHLKRFQLKQYEKDITKRLKKEFPDLEVNVSTDQKMIIEVEQLEQAIASDSISEKELKKKMKHIIKLSKEKT